MATRDPEAKSPKSEIVTKRGALGRLGDFADEWLPEFLLGIPGIAGIAASVYSTKTLNIAGWDTTYGEAILSISAICIIVGAIWIALKKKEVGELRRSEAEYKRIALKYGEDTQGLIQDGLRDLAKDCELNNGDRACRTDTRISVYCHDREKGRFIPIARISGDPEFEKSGRSYYPDDQGIICKAWRNEIFSYQFDLEPEMALSLAKQLDKTVAEITELIWLDDQVNEFNVPEEVALEFSMKSKSIVAWRIEYLHTKIGVVVIESTDKGVADGALKAKVGSSSHFPPLQRALFRFNESHIRNVASNADQN